MLAILTGFKEDRAGINSVVDHNFVFGLFRRRKEAGLESNCGGQGKIQAERLPELLIAPAGFHFGIGFRVGGVVSEAVAQLDSRAVRLEADLAELAVPLLVLRMIAEGVVG